MTTIIMGPETYTKKLIEYIDDRIKIWEKQKEETNAIGKTPIAPEFVLAEFDILREKILNGYFDED